MHACRYRALLTPFHPCQGACCPQRYPLKHVCIRSVDMRWLACTFPRGFRAPLHLSKRVRGSSTYSEGELTNAARITSSCQNWKLSMIMNNMISDVCKNLTCILFQSGRRMIGGGRVWALIRQRGGSSPARSRARSPCSRHRPRRCGRTAREG